MTERSLFNVACKLLGLWLLFRSGSAFVWAFLMSCYYANYSVFDPSEDLGWSSWAVSMAAGLFLCCRSGWLTQLVFRIDPPLDTDSADSPPRRLMPFSSNVDVGKNPDSNAAINSVDIHD